MESWFKKLIGTREETNSKGVGNINPQKRLQIATCAILMEIAGADDNFTDDERTMIIETLKQEYSLSKAEIEELMVQTKNEIDKSVDVWSFAHIIDENLSEPEKIKIMEAIWEIIYSDGQLSAYEDVFVHKLYFLLGLTHEQMIDTKMRVLDQIRANSGEDHKV
jgi:uncharacterized tellurite resistance protein B-like protein